MKLLPRAVLFDVYRTLLDVREPPPHADRRWEDLCRRTFGEPPGRSLGEVSAACRGIVAGDHARARQAGIPFPEVDWPSVFRRAFEPARRLDPPALSDFLFHHATLGRSVGPMLGATGILRRCREAGIACGIASNAQAYTLRELREALESGGLDPGLFDSRLVFWSFENGFSKPDPHVFRLLATRLAGLGIAPEEALVIGDREDNDIRPAQALGFQTFLFIPPPDGSGWPPILSAPGG
ncbi:MAG: HAD family hydrolase [Terrimicrobiaceae bacterium]|jgi:putative hydrolase of the HAD superfamily